MTPQVIHFQCTACQAHLTVPVHLAGVTGPCPKCGHTITSPAATPEVPASNVPPFPAPAPASPPPAQTLPPAVTAQPTPQLPPIPPVAPVQPPVSPLAGLEPSVAPGTALPPRRSPAPAEVPSLLSGLQAPSPLTPPAGSPQLPSAPTLPPLEGTRPDPVVTAPAAGSLLNSVLSSKETAPATHPTPPQPESAAPSPPPVASAPVLGGRREPLPPFPNKPGRGSNVARLGIAVFLLLACVALLGYVGRDMLKDLYHQHVAPRLFPQAKEVSPPPDVPVVPTPAPEPVPEVPLVKETPTPTSAPDYPPKPGQLATETPTPPPPAPTVPTPPDSPDPPPMPAAAEPGKVTPPEEIKKATPAEPEKATTPPVPSSPSPLVEVPPAGAASTPNPQTPEISIPDEAKPASAALMEFLSAENLETKRKYILGAEDPQIDALIKRYYGESDAKPTAITSILLRRHDPSPEVGGGAQSVFEVASPEWTYPIPVMVQETKKGFKLDWIAFVEFKDNWLHKFVQSFRENPGRFHVRIKRGHYFESDVPGIENKDCFILEPPQGDFEVSVFVPKDNALSEKLRRDLSWGTRHAYVLAEIQWRDDGARQWIELTDVPQLNWHISTDTPGNNAASGPEAK